MSHFSHLHCHTQYSLLDGAAEIPALFKKAAKDGHRALAITDHGNMFGVFQFVAEAWKTTKPTGRKDAAGRDIMEPVVKPIVGCEFYVVKNRHEKSFAKGNRDKRYHQVMLAKNKQGYNNLVKLCSLGYIEGLYSKYPRIDKELITQYHEGLIATTCCLAGEIPRAILNEGEEKAEELFKWWLDLFGDDYYIEMQRHGIGDQNKVNEVLWKFHKKYGTPIICTNDSHYVNQSDYNAHDILLCINTGDKQSTPTNKTFSEENGGFQKGTRFAFENDQFYFKTEAEMLHTFKDIPQALDNTQLIVDKIEPLQLQQEILLPNFEIPVKFESQDEYLKHLTYEGAKKRYHELTDEVKDRIEFELHTIRTMGFAGYFLIVQDFINKGKEIGVYIGPGRGSAAGSVVAYCIGITNIDPIKYNLLFERFLNPDRKSMPDIDTDFEDAGREKVIDYVVQKYGERQVAQIVTYGTMAAKSSIKDVARVLDLPLQESNALAKLVPDKPGVELKVLLTESMTDANGKFKKYELKSEDLTNVELLREIMNGTDLRAETLKEAVKLEGSIRNTGVHAAGVIIAPKDLTEIIPMARAKDSKLLVTQYDGKVIESAGVIKMDFLGLKTLSILKDCVELIKTNYGIDLDLDTIPLDDAKTFELYQKGETNATFQFESKSMQKYLQDLKPDKFEDLVAMNALYRPGPMDYIPDFIDRKFGRKPIVYDLPEMEEYLKDTYGITVYQEQVMLLSQKLAGFTKGDADTLRKAMGKKKIEILNKMEIQFVEGATQKGHPKEVLLKIWNDWKKFAAYAFNKSHSVCYALVAYQTAYLKVHYPAEFMAGVLSNNYNNAEKVSFFLAECRRMGIKVLCPDVNESDVKFTVNKKGEIRFTLSALKGLGGSAAQAIIQEREENGPYTDIYDFVKRVDLRAVNKRSMEALAKSGAFDALESIERAQYLVEQKNGQTFIDQLIRFGSIYKKQKESAVETLFGESFDNQLATPEPSFVPNWDNLQDLYNEKEVIGIYLTGHPLDVFSMEQDFFCNARIRDVEKNTDKTLMFSCLVKNVDKRVSREGKPFAILKVEDLQSEMELRFFGEDYVKFAAYFEKNNRLRVTGVMKRRYKDSTEYSFRVYEIEYLNELMNKEGQFLEIGIDAMAVNITMIHELERILKRHKGDKPLRISIDTNRERVPIHLKSTRVKVDLCDELLEEVKQLDILSYTIRPDESKYIKVETYDKFESEEQNMIEEED